MWRRDTNLVECCYLIAQEVVDPLRIQAKHWPNFHIIINFGEGEGGTAHGTNEPCALLVPA